MQSISVCIIAKNEENAIEACLRSIRRHPFEIIVVDTGSTDGTKQIAAKYADKVLDFEWEQDFSDARNFAANESSNDWILCLDCDEEITKIDYRNMLELASSHPTAIGEIQQYYMQTSGFKSTTPAAIERIYNKNLYEFSGAIHEHLVAKSGSAITSIPYPVVIDNKRPAKPLSPEEQIESEIARLTVAIERHPEEQTLYYELGCIYMKQQDYEAAFVCLNQGMCLPFDSTLDYVQRMIIAYGDSMLNTGRTEQALMLANVADKFSTLADFAFLMGNVYYQARLYDKALVEYLRATSLRKFFQKGVNSYRAYYKIGCIYEIYEQYDKAILNLKKAGDYLPALEKINEIKEK